MADKSLTQSAADARQLLRGFRQFDEAAQALDRAAGLEQTVNELNASIKSLTAQREAAGEELRAVQADVEAAKAEANRINAAATVEAKQIAATARAEAERIAAEAAERDLRDAERHRSEMATMRKQATDAEKRAEAARAETAELEARAAEARAFIDKLKA